MSILPGMDVATGGAGTDPFFHRVQALYHFDTNLNDASSYRSQMINNGGVSLNTSVSRLGGASGNFPGGASDFLRLPHEDRFSLGSGDMTVECFVRTTLTSFNLTSRDQNIACKSWAYGNSAPNWALLISKGRLQFRVGRSGAAWEQSVQSTGNVIPNGWHHVIGQKTGNSISLYCDGALHSTATLTQVPEDAAPNEYRFGKNSPGNGDGPLFGQIDEFRLTMGVSRYSGSTYTVPTAPYPDN